MSVRLWWKFSPYLMTPVPMIATFPPSPIVASLAPPSLTDPADGEPEHGRGGAGERPADRLERTARFEPEESGERVEPLAEREHADRHHRHHPAEGGSALQTEAAAARRARRDEGDGQERRRRGEAAREERRERVQDALGRLPRREPDQGDFGEQRGAERAGEGDRVADEGDRHRAHRAARNPRVSARASARRWSIVTDASAKSPPTPRLAKAQPQARGPASTPPRRSMIAPKT